MINGRIGGWMGGCINGYIGEWCVCVCVLAHQEIVIHFHISSGLGAEVFPDIDVGKRKFAMNIVPPTSDQSGELRLAFETVSYTPLRVCVCVWVCVCVGEGTKSLSLSLSLPPSLPPSLLSQSDEYCSWMAGCRMAMKGRPLAKQGYEQELSSIRAFVSMQEGSGSSGPTSTDHGVRPHPL